MKRTKLTLALFTIICATIMLALTACNSNGSKEKSMDNTQMNMGSASMSSPAANLRTAMRQLWEEHVTWTRNVVFCLVDDLPGTDQAVARLLKNQDDIGNAIKPYYGEAAGKKLTDLLYPHIKIAAEVAKAARAGNTAALDDANKRWYANADEISEFLSKANPNWDLTDMKKMMHDHLKFLTDYLVARIKKDYDADVKAYDNGHDQILKMADMLSEGIVMQFPEKFKGSTAGGMTK